MSQDGASSVCEAHDHSAPACRRVCGEDPNSRARSPQRLLRRHNHENGGRAVQTATPPPPPHTHTTPCNQHHRRRRLPSQHPAPPRPPPQLIAGLIQAAGRPACKLALRALGPQVNYILHGDPLAEPHDYADPTEECEARHCLTADDLRKIDEGRAAEWAAAQPVAKVAPIFATHPRPDLALTLSLSSPAYMLITHSLAPSIPSLYPRPCSSTAPSRRQPFP